MLEGIPEYMKGKSATPAVHHLFDTAEDVTKLSLTNSEILHHLMAHLLYILNQAQLDIQLVISFLCTKVI